jgi:hypothetical protein
LDNEENLFTDRDDDQLWAEIQENQVAKNFPIPPHLFHKKKM